MNLWQLSWQNLWQRPLTAALSWMLLTLGVGIISLLLILNHQLKILSSAICKVLIWLWGLRAAHCS
ncbi:MAG: hypothetical protein IPN25_06465 [Sphingobacteriales bacterium]|nr:hypothetical protein [Sphingobacteriales bacterium]